MNNFLKQYKTHIAKQEKGNPYKPGFYLVKVSDDSRHFVSANIDVGALERVADNVLTDTDYDYWIDYMHGLDVKGAPAWSNIDQTNRFF